MHTKLIDGELFDVLWDGHEYLLPEREERSMAKLCMAQGMSHVGNGEIVRRARQAAKPDGRGKSEGSQKALKYAREHQHIQVHVEVLLRRWSDHRAEVRGWKYSVCIANWGVAFSLGWDSTP